MYEDDLDYAARRLNNTLVRDKAGNPVYITRTFYDDLGVMRHKAQNLVTDENIVLAHADLDLEPVPLGFVNIDNSMVFVCRKPMRRDWRQGLSHNSMMTFGHLRPDEINIKMLVQPIMQQYPTFNRALESIGRKRSIAFCRDFGLSKSGEEVSLMYRQHKVGKIEDGKPVLDENKLFLQQHLSEVVA